MRVLFVLETSWTTRGPAQHHHLLERLKERGHEVVVIDFDIDWREKAMHLVAPREVMQVDGKTSPGGKVTVIRPSMLRAPLVCYFTYGISMCVEVVRQIRRFNPDIVMGSGILNVYLASAIGHYFGLPFVRYILDSDEHAIPEKLLRPVGSWLVSQGLKRSDRVLVINKQLGEYARRMSSGVEPRVVTAGIDKSRFHPDIDGSQIRKELGLAKDEIVLFFMGWLYRFSGLKEVALELVRRNSTKVRLLVLGRGPLYDDLDGIRASMPHGDRILLVNWVSYDEVPKYIASSDICILPAECNETMRDIVPIKMYEYLACGKPVIATKLPGIIREFGSRGGVVYVDSPIELIDVAIELCNAESRYDDIKESALEYTRMLSWQSIVDRFETILQDLIDETG